MLNIAKLLHRYVLNMRLFLEIQIWSINRILSLSFTEEKIEYIYKNLMKEL